MDGKDTIKGELEATGLQDLFILPHEIIRNASMLSRALLTLTDVKGEELQNEKIQLICARITILSVTLGKELKKLKGK